jgi:hypothetical protein
VSLFPVLSPKVVSIGYAFPPIFIPYLPDKCSELRDFFGTDFCPPPPDSDRVWYLMTPWKCLVKLEDGYLCYTANRGWWTDLASIPGCFESFEKRDDRAATVAALCHDMSFAVQYPFFDAANSLFYQMMRKAGESKWSAWWKWAAVDSVAGYSAWRLSSFPITVAHEKQWVRVEEVPEVPYSHKHLIRYLK